MGSMYCFSLDDDYYELGCNTVNKTLKEAFRTASEYDFEDGILKVHIGTVKYYNDNEYLDFEDIIEKMKDTAYDEGGEHAENYLEDISEEDINWAQAKFLELWKQFKKRTKNEEVFFEAENIKTYYLDKKGKLITKEEGCK